MADAHDLLFLRQLLLDVGIDVFLIANLLQHLNDAFVRAAVQRPFQRADRRSDGGIKVAQRRNCYPGAKGRCVHPVIGVQDEGDIERVGCFLGLRFATY